MQAWPLVLMLLTLPGMGRAAPQSNAAKALHDLFNSAWDQEMREGIRERMVHPRVIMERIPAQIDKQIVSDPTQSGFYKPFKSFPSAISQADQQRLQQEARKAVEQQVVPAFAKFKQFFVSEYLPDCYDKVGAWQLPHGEELYAQMIRHYTTTNETTEEVHQIGLKEVARINGEMDHVMQQTGFKGSRDEFL